MPASKRKPKLSLTEKRDAELYARAKNAYEALQRETVRHHDHLETSIRRHMIHRLEEIKKKIRAEVIDPEHPVNGEATAKMYKDQIDKMIIFINNKRWTSGSIVEKFTDEKSDLYKQLKKIHEDIKNTADWDFRNFQFYTKRFGVVYDLVKEQKATPDTLAGIKSAVTKQKAYLEKNEAAFKKYEGENDVNITLKNGKKTSLGKLKKEARTWQRRLDVVLSLVTFGIYPVVRGFHSLHTKHSFSMWKSRPQLLAEKMKKASRAVETKEERKVRKTRVKKA